ncbi:MAG: hypothetical protein LBF34_03080, partial [Puniceicoccales bacterium]|nr:hypothetical protein [Puniceicoccales bacterium]
VRKGLRNNIIGSLLLGSSIAAITPTQAGQRSNPPPNREMTGWTKEEGAEILKARATMTPEEKKKRKKKTKSDNRTHETMQSDNGMKYSGGGIINK